MSMARGDRPRGEGQKGLVSGRPRCMNRSAVVWCLLGTAAAQGFSCWGQGSPQCQGLPDSDDALHAVLRGVEGGAGPSSGRTPGSLTRWLLEGFSGGGTGGILESGGREGPGRFPSWRPRRPW